jgi:hypothetical protein
MKLILQTLMVFFGTLVAAGLVALGEPGQAAVQPTPAAVAATALEIFATAGPGSR